MKRVDVLTTSRNRVMRSPFSWLAGGEERVFALVPSERPFFAAQGMVIAALAVANGFVLSVSGSAWWNVPLRQVLWFGVAWSVLFCLIERLVQKSFGTSGRLNAAITVPRAALSVAMALVFAVPVSQLIYRPSINNQLSATATQQIREESKRAISFYGPKISAAQNQIRGIQRSESALRRRIVADEFRANCEAGLTTCSQSHKLGRGPYYRRDVADLSQARSALAAVQPANARAISQLQANIRIWERTERAQINGRTKAISAGTDLLARQEALAAIEKTHPEVSTYIVFLLVFFCAMDLVPLTMKLTHLVSTGGAYEKAAAALRRRDHSSVHQLLEETKTLQLRTSESARAEEEVDRIRIAVDRELRIAFELDKLAVAPAMGPNDLIEDLHV